MKPTDEGDNKPLVVHKTTEEEKSFVCDFVLLLAESECVRCPCRTERCHMGKSPDLSDFERGMIVGARRAGCSISETVNRLGFSKTSVSRVYREWCQEHKTSSQRGSCGRKRLVDGRGERVMESVVEANNRATTEQIQALYNSSGHDKPISLRTTRRTLKRLGYSHRAQRRDSLAMARLEALAVCASRPEQLETASADVVGSDQSEPGRRVHTSTDRVCRNDPGPLGAETAKGRPRSHVASY